MPTVNPQTFFRFAADHHELLVELYQHRDGMSEAELYQLIRRFAGEGAPAASHIAGRLRDLGILDVAPQATAQFEMTRPFAELMSHLLREYRLTSVEVIQSYFTAMDSYTAEIRKASDDVNGDLMVRTLRDVAEHVERMRQDSRHNREEIVGTAMRVKANRERLPPLRRYEIINRLWTRYLVPLRDMIDTQKAMDVSLDRIEASFEAADVAFSRDAPVNREIATQRARVRRLRRDVVLDFRESIREIAPLYEELRQENALARGAAHALDMIGKKGLARLGLPERMGLCNWQQQGLFSDTALNAYILTLRGYVPKKPDPIAEGAACSAASHIGLREFDANVMAALPIEDGLKWLDRAYPGTPLGTLLRLYGRLHAGRLGAVRFGNKQERYAMRGALLEAHPMRVERKTKDARA